MGKCVWGLGVGRIWEIGGNRLKKMGEKNERIVFLKLTRGRVLQRGYIGVVVSSPRFYFSAFIF